MYNLLIFCAVGLWAAVILMSLFFLYRFILDIIKKYDKRVFDKLCKSDYTPEKYAKYCKLYNKKLKNDNKKSA